ncbi:MAG: metal-dependent hydrolase [Bryobacteraceae bacterium]|nr:metal-dependent hydrolase [Bryobacterales bacterium]MEB2361775.1 metal-dependent hydrolase [Bryobacterales bacterium]NUN01696.1 metal-dependent hydrolase [Bryobacteraceae bacterium]
MDNLTHTLTGIALSRAGLNRWCPHAAAVLVLSSNAPDIDAVSGFWGATAYLHYHRHLTHALVSIPVLALLCAASVALLFGKSIQLRRDALRLAATAAVGVALHQGMDFTNIYGIRPLLPFSAKWLRLDIISIVDLWLWVVLFLAATAPLLSRLVNAEIGAKGGSGRGLAVLALSFLVLYSGVRSVLHARAVETLNSRLYAGQLPRRTAAFPSSWNPFAWRGLVETDNSYNLYELDLLGQFDPSAARTLYKIAPDKITEAASRTEPFRVFLAFSPYTFWRIEKDTEEGLLRVEAMDLRFGAPPEPRFVASAIVDTAGRVRSSQFGFGPLRLR